MAASSANRFDTAAMKVSTIPFPVAAVHIYQNTNVGLNSAGFLTPMADTSGLVYVGVATEEVDNSAGAAGDKTCRVTPCSKDPFQEFDAATPLAAWRGKILVFTDDHTVTYAVGAGTNDIRAGLCLEITATGASGKVILDTTQRFASPAAEA